MSTSTLLPTLLAATAAVTASNPAAAQGTALPPTKPQSAIWHFGWHVTDIRKSLAEYKSRPDVELLPLYTTDEGGYVLINSDTWPGTGGVLGLTREQIAEARAKGV